MRRGAALAGAAGAAVMALAASGAVYGVGPTRTVVVTRLGRPVRLVGPSVGGALGGLHVKWPLVEAAVEFDRRPRTVVAGAVEGADAAGRPLQASAYLSYVVADPVRFLAVFGGPGAADLRLQAELEAAVRTALHAAGPDGGGPDPGALGEAALRDARRRLAALGAGVAARDLRLTGVTLPASALEGAARRMQLAAATEAVRVRAEGEADKRALMAAADREAVDLRGEAERQALELRGQGDAERTTILGAAYGADPDFARFFRRLDAYDQALNPDNTALVLSTDNAFLQPFADGPAGRR